MATQTESLCAIDDLSPPYASIVRTNVLQHLPFKQDIINNATNTKLVPTLRADTQTYPHIRILKSSHFFLNKQLPAHLILANRKPKLAVEYLSNELA